MNKQAFTNINPQTITLAVMLISTLSFTGSWVAENMFNMQPCPLCLLQRHTHIVIAITAATTLMAIKCEKRTWVLISLALLLVLAVFGALVAGYQSFLERFSDTCPITNNSGQENIPNCAEIRHSFFGLTFANANTILQIVLTTAVTIVLRTHINTTDKNTKDKT